MFLRQMREIGRIRGLAVPVFQTSLNVKFPVQYFINLEMYIITHVSPIGHSKMESTGVDFSSQKFHCLFEIIETGQGNSFVLRYYLKEMHTFF